MCAPVTLKKPQANVPQGPWGEELASSIDNVPGGIPYRYIGAHGVRLDAIAGLLYKRKRWYDSGLARFINRDPARFSAGIHPYRYVNNNPLTRIDVFGLDYILVNPNDLGMKGVTQYDVSVQKGERPHTHTQFSTQEIEAGHRVPNEVWGTSGDPNSGLGPNDYRADTRNPAYNSRVKDHGPIVPGPYRIYRDEIETNVEDPNMEGWGTYRAPMHPLHGEKRPRKAGHQTASIFGRDDMNILSQPSSATGYNVGTKGCLSLFPTNHAEELFDVLLNDSNIKWTKDPRGGSILRFGSMIRLVIRCIIAAVLLASACTASKSMSSATLVTDGAHLFTTRYFNLLEARLERIRENFVFSVWAGSGVIDTPRSYRKQIIAGAPTPIRGLLLEESFTGRSVIPGAYIFVYEQHSQHKTWLDATVHYGQQLSFSLQTQHRIRLTGVAAFSKGDYEEGLLRVLDAIEREYQERGFSRTR